MKSQRWFNRYGKYQYLQYLQYLNAGGGEKKTEISADSLQDAFIKISEIFGDDFKRRVLEV